jgi:hypothetical protein
MGEDIKEKKLRIAIMALQTGAGHLRSIGLEAMADELNDIIRQCNDELINIAPEAVPGILMERDEDNS